MIGAVVGLIGAFVGLTAIFFIVLTIWCMIGVIVSDSFLGVDLDDLTYLDDSDKNKFKKAPIAYFALVPFALVSIPVMRRKEVSDRAKEDAVYKYNNIFDNKSFQKLYDKSFKKARLNYIDERAKNDVKAAGGYTYRPDTTAFDNPVERRLYQEAYMKHIGETDDNAKSIKERYNNLYKGFEESKISNKEFEKIVSKKIA